MMAVFLNILCEKSRPGPAGELTLRGTRERKAEYRRIKSRRCSQTNTSRSQAEMERQVGMHGGPLSLETECRKFPGKAGMLWAEDTYDKPVCCLNVLFGHDRMVVIHEYFCFVLFLFSLKRSVTLWRSFLEFTVS